MTNRVFISYQWFRVQPATPAVTATKTKKVQCFVSSHPFDSPPFAQVVKKKASTTDTPEKESATTAAPEPVQPAGMMLRISASDFSDLFSSSGSRGGAQSGAGQEEDSQA